MGRPGVPHCEHEVCACDNGRCAQVTLGVWQATGAQDLIGKIFGVFFPVLAFVAIGAYPLLPVLILPAESHTVGNKVYRSSLVLACVAVGDYFLLPVLTPHQLKATQQVVDVLVTLRAP